MLLTKFQKMRFEKVTLLEYVFSSSTHWRVESYFIMLLVSNLDPQVQNGRADCLWFPETVIHCFQIQLARIQSETSARI